MIKSPSFDFKKTADTIIRPKSKNHIDTEHSYLYCRNKSHIIPNMSCVTEGKKYEIIYNREGFPSGAVMANKAYCIFNRYFYPAGKIHKSGITSRVLEKTKFPILLFSLEPYGKKYDLELTDPRYYNLADPNIYSISPSVFTDYPEVPVQKTKKCKEDIMGRRVIIERLEIYETIKPHITINDLMRIWGFKDVFTH